MSPTFRALAHRNDDRERPKSASGDETFACLEVAELLGDEKGELGACAAREVELDCDGQLHPVPDAGSGWRSLVVPAARPGSLYRYRINGDLIVPDPASRFQPQDVDGPSMVVEPRSYTWRQTGWSRRP